MTEFPTDAILITIKVASFSTAISFAFSVLLAYVMSRRNVPGRRIIDSLCTLPIVLPPTVLGFFLLVIVGRRGVLGAWLAEQGINLIFSWQGAVLAATVVIFPLIYKSARGAFDGVDRNLENAARSLGANEVKVFFLVSLPQARNGIIAGTLLAFARGMGEFGATLMIAGNIPGKTQTLALAIYDAFSAGKDTQAALLAATTSAICLAILVSADWLFSPSRQG
ncbi:molybdate ABC transporter permease subunit [Fundidesulfovibrio putealis]|uniref:molybdate ABC transporter permease subunit n=1 Tax=Fundidesulfovibrio putealis TaxID=270496 RepID=UPI00041F8213|nr:molybdate ABC transporter permease subunit [Fundidesulfovibrio putealis]